MCLIAHSQLTIDRQNKTNSSLEVPCMHGHVLDHTHDIFRRAVMASDQVEEASLASLAADPLQIHRRCSGGVVHMSWRDCEEHLNELWSSLG